MRGAALIHNSGIFEWNTLSSECFVTDNPYLGRMRAPRNAATLFKDFGWANTRIGVA
jgi:hypothetical protein